MKKALLLGALFITFVFAISSISLISNPKDNSLIGANVEVLSQSEEMPGDNKKDCYYHEEYYNPTLYIEVISCETCETVKTFSIYNRTTCIQLK